MADLRTDPEFQARLREYSRQMRQSTPNMWISPNGIVHEVDNHLDFVAQTRFGADNSEDYADKTGDPDVYNTLSEEAETMLEAGWIRVVGHSGGVAFAGRPRACTSASQSKRTLMRRSISAVACL